MDWYCATADGQRHGPVQASQPRERTDIGSIGPVQRDGVAPRQTLAEAAAEPGLYASPDACRRRAAAQATSSPARGFDPAPSSTLATACLPAGLAAVHGACRPACRRAAGDAAGTYEALRKATPADPGGRAAAGHLLRRRDGVRRDKGSAAMTDWYYALDGQRHGPVQAAELAGLARSGAIAAQTLVWRDGLAQWSP